MGSSYVCNARTAGIEFPKAVGIAAATYVQLLNGRHGGMVASTGNKKLTNEQLFAGAEFQIITGAMQFCPDKVPADVKTKVEEALKTPATGWVPPRRCRLHAKIVADTPAHGFRLHHDSDDPAEGLQTLPLSYSIHCFGCGDRVRFR
jgi:hypothetical protein